MRNLKIILGAAVLVLVAMAGWQIAAAEIANLNLQEDLRDMGSQAGAHLGVVVPYTDEDEIGAVIRKAKEHGIDLEPAQITLRRIGTGDKSTLYLAADYGAPIHLMFFSFNLHFTPSSSRNGN
jgi:hypothetical protein